MRRRKAIAVLTVVAVAAVTIGYAFAMVPANTAPREGRPATTGRRYVTIGTGRPPALDGIQADFVRAMMRPEDIGRMTSNLGLIERMKRLCFDPAAAGLVAAGGLRDDVRRKYAETTKDLEAQLAKTKTLGLRNALRLTLGEIYKRQDDDEKVLEHLRAMLAENDAALQAKKK